MTYLQFKQTCKDWLIEFGNYSEPAVELLAMICAHESLGGKFRRQMGNGPARSIYQVERIAHDDVWDRHRSIHTNAIKVGIKRDWGQMEQSDRYATFVARHIIALDPKPIPTDPKQMAEWCKRNWNKGGKATPEKYLNDYNSWVTGKI